MQYDEYIIQELEDEIIRAFNGLLDYTEKECLLAFRKSILNHYALQRQETLLPAIVEFNEALKEALLEMYNRAFRIWNDMKNKETYGENIRLSACCYLDSDYPSLHPVQGDNRQDLWDALCDAGWNVMYEDGVSHTFSLPNDEETRFDTFIGMDCPPPNWNEGLDRELTKDLHLIFQFHHLFSHMNFALTDLIYVRKFRTEIHIEIEK